MFFSVLLFCFLFIFYIIYDIINDIKSFIEKETTMATLPNSYLNKLIAVEECFVELIERDVITKEMLEEFGLESYG